jgi:hypothetical protein
LLLFCLSASETKLLIAGVPGIACDFLALSTQTAALFGLRDPLSTFEGTQNKSKKLCSFSAETRIQPGTMPIPIRQANQPIFDRLGRNVPKPAPASQKSSIDAEADEIRKIWIESTTARPK